jgi:hypothetical protein
VQIEDAMVQAVYLRHDADFVSVEQQLRQRSPVQWQSQADGSIANVPPQHTHIFPISDGRCMSSLPLSDRDDR